MSWSIVQALHSVPMLLTNLCKYVFLTRYPMPCHTLPIFPKQNTMRRSLPAEKRLTLDWRKARHLWLKNTMDFLSDWGEIFPMQKNAVCIARSSWCGMQGFVVVPRFDLESCGSCGMINLWMLAWWPEGIALVLTLELGPWVDQELPGTKNKLRNATVLVIVDSLAFRVLFFSMERIWNLRWNLSVFPFCHTNSQVFFLMIFGCLTRLTELGDS